MSVPFDPDAIRALSVSERLALVEAIWDTITDETDSIPLTEAQRAELDRRIAASKANPNEGATWDEVKARLLRPPHEPHVDHPS
jgi:putative addiction module component (TIGR02574 family)